MRTKAKPKRYVAKPKRKPPRNDEVPQRVFDALLDINEDARSAGSFGGVNKLLRAARAANIDVSAPQVRRFLAAVPAYGIHRQLRSKRIERRRIVAMDIDWLWEIDIAYMDRVAEANDGYLYLLVSKQLAVEPLKDKSAHETLEGLRRICARVGTLPRRIACDGGLEFNNELVKTWATDNDIRLYFLALTEQGAAVAVSNSIFFYIRCARYRPPFGELACLAARHSCVSFT